MNKVILIVVLFSISFSTHSADLFVPADYPTIQQAIDAASNGDLIIVDNGTYFENIDFIGKDITVTSNFHTSGNINDIVTTIINGGQPIDSEFGSCVRFMNNESEQAILKGFTLTGGIGTRTYNAVEDLYFRTGGGILIDNASPTIIHNIITENQCSPSSDVFAAGGGGIRMGFGQPVIENNLITFNIGEYAGGIMIAYCGGSILKNNLIANNTATGAFNGGGGVYVDWEAVTLENNTIANNFSGDKGGGIISTGTSTVVINCIIYGNTATNGDDQIFRRFGGNAAVTYSNIEGGFNGMGNEEGVIDQDPEFDNTDNFILTPSSPCVDAGNPDTQYNDIEDPDNPGNALFPSQGTLRNDMGTYGGSGAEVILSNLNQENRNDFNVLYQNPYKNEGIIILSEWTKDLQLIAYDLGGKIMSPSLQITINPGRNLIPFRIESTAVILLRDVDGNGLSIKLLKI